MNTPKPFSWSFSALEVFQNCPRKYWAMYVEKIQAPKSAEASKGIDEHKALEDYLRKGVPLPTQLRGVQPVADQLLALPGKRMPEAQYAIDASFEPCGWRDWDRPWLRAVLDFVHVSGDTAVYVDWKSGKYRPSDQQLKLSSLVLFQHYPDVQQVKGLLAFVYYDRSHAFTLRRAEAHAAWSDFLPTVGKMMEARANGNFPASPNPLCGWCPYKACPHNTNRS